MLKIATFLFVPLMYCGYMYSTFIKGAKLHRKIRHSRITEIRAQQDCMGYENSEFLKDYSDEEILIAQALAKSDNYVDDPIRNDPRVHGRRYLKYAKVAFAVMSGEGNDTD